ncbi:MAG: PRC-barrel domain-containing protein [Pseudorhodoplanes sp.]|nr:PRC-barrel domain-containing protein [Pseudorhodoplanes sp.]
MLKQLMLSTALTALVAGGAVAQSANPAMPKQESQMQSTTGANTAGSGQFIASQAADQWLASNFEGADVIGPNDEKIGDVKDVLFSKDGQIVAYVIGVGGFLGIGQKDVALAPSSFQVIPGASLEDRKLRLSMTKDQLQQAQAFVTQREREAAARRATTGSGAVTAPRPTMPPASTNR